LLTSSFAANHRQFYTVLETQLIVILFLHSLVQSYKKQCTRVFFLKQSHLPIMATSINLSEGTFSQWGT